MFSKRLILFVSMSGTLFLAGCWSSTLTAPDVVEEQSPDVQSLDTPNVVNSLLTGDVGSGFGVVGGDEDLPIDPQGGVIEQVKD